MQFDLIFSIWIVGIVTISQLYAGPIPSPTMKITFGSCYRWPCNLHFVLVGLGYLRQNLTRMTRVVPNTDAPKIELATVVLPNLLMKLI